MIKDVIIREIGRKKGQGAARDRTLGTMPCAALAAGPAGFNVVSTKWRQRYMSSPYRIERDRGVKESGKQLAVLRAKWPLAFRVKRQDVRPLAIGAVGEIGSAMGWSHPYTLGVLSGWKMAAVYCRAVLCYDQRITLMARRPSWAMPTRKPWQPSSWQSSPRAGAQRHRKSRRLLRNPRIPPRPM